MKLSTHIQKVIKDAHCGDRNAAYDLACVFGDKVLMRELRCDTSYFGYIKLAADSGHGDACLDLSNNFYMGNRGFLVDVRKAVQYARKGADKGHVGCKLQLANMLNDCNDEWYSYSESKKLYKELLKCKDLDSGYVYEAKMGLLALENNAHSARV